MAPGRRGPTYRLGPCVGPCHGPPESSGCPPNHDAGRPHRDGGERHERDDSDAEPLYPAARYPAYEAHGTEPPAGHHAHHGLHDGRVGVRLRPRVRVLTLGNDYTVGHERCHRSSDCFGVFEMHVPCPRTSISAFTRLCPPVLQPTVSVVEQFDDTVECESGDDVRSEFAGDVDFGVAERREKEIGRAHV